MTRNLVPLLLCIAVPAVASCGGSDDEAAARPARGAPVEVALKPRHGATVTGTAVLVPGVEDMSVKLELGKRVRLTLPAHIHTGPCSDEPTAKNPRIWANLTDVVDGRSETTVNVVALGELQAETSSINIHDPSHGNRALVCGDIPRAG